MPGLPGFINPQTGQYVPAGLTPAQTHQLEQNNTLNVGQDVKNAISSLNPLGALFQRNIWVRVAEVVTGLILLGIGLNALMKGKPMSVVTKTAGLAAKAVPA